MGVKREALENGKVLQILIEQFANNRTEQNLYALLRCLRDSFVWIPGNFIMNKEDKEKFINATVGEIVTNDFDMKFEPDILQNGEDKFYPVFSNIEAMGEYGNNFSKIEKHFFEAMSYAMGKEETVGIVVDAFTNPFVVPKDWFEDVSTIPTNIIEDEVENGNGKEN